MTRTVKNLFVNGTIKDTDNPTNLSKQEQIQGFFPGISQSNLATHLSAAMKERGQLAISSSLHMSDRLI
jgi:hypothetical protein